MVAAISFHVVFLKFFSLINNRLFEIDRLILISREVVHHLVQSSEYIVYGMAIFIKLLSLN